MHKKNPTDKALGPEKVEVYNLPPPSIPLISNTPNVENKITLEVKNDSEEDRRAMLVNYPYLKLYQHIEDTDFEC